MQPVRPRSAGWATHRNLGALCCVVPYPSLCAKAFFEYASRARQHELPLHLWCSRKQSRRRSRNPAPIVMAVRVSTTGRLGRGFYPRSFLALIKRSIDRARWMRRNRNRGRRLLHGAENKNHRACKEGRHWKTPRIWVPQTLPAPPMKRWAFCTQRSMSPAVHCGCTLHGERSGTRGARQASSQALYQQHGAEVLTEVAVSSRMVCRPRSRSRRTRARTGPAR